MRAIPAIRNNLNKLLTLQSQITHSSDSKVKQGLALKCAELVLPIWNFYYPHDNTVRNCIETVKKFLKGEVSVEEVRKVADDTEANATYAVYTAAYTAYAAANAANAAVYTAYAPAYATYTADYTATHSIKATKFFFKINEK